VIDVGVREQDRVRGDACAVIEPVATEVDERAPPVVGVDEQDAVARVPQRAGLDLPPRAEKRQLHRRTALAAPVIVGERVRRAGCGFVPLPGHPLHRDAS
jgi:hypothetical protein